MILQALCVVDVCFCNHDINGGMSTEWISFPVSQVDIIIGRRQEEVDALQFDMSSK